MNSADLRIAQELKGRLQAHLQLRRLAVFGSRARGDADPESDMDVLVELDSVGSRDRAQVTEDAWEVSFHTGVVIVPVTVDRREWEEGVQKSSLLAQAIALEGVEV